MSHFAEVWQSMSHHQKVALTTLVGSSYSTMSQYANGHICASPKRAGKIRDELRRLGYRDARTDWLWDIPR